MGEPAVVARGVAVPALGFGTWQLRGDACYQGVLDALALGYRHIDTAQMYGNEAEVGRALREADVDRDEVFVVTKVPPRNLAADAVRSSHEASLERLGLDDVDLLLIHWPSDAVPLAETLEAMGELRERGLTRHLGVSNFPPPLVEEALRHAPILTNQVEYHPLLDQSELVRQCTELDLFLTAYSPLAKGRVVGEPTLEAIGARRSKTAAQVAIRWLVQQERVATIPRSSDAAHRRANREVFDFALSDEEMAAVSALARGERVVDPP